jgi:hypothetical protein
MTDTRKPDLRDQSKVATSITNTDSRMAGGDDRPQTVKSHSNMHEVTPEIGKHLAEGQVTKSN